jgi:PKD repeat protein
VRNSYIHSDDKYLTCLFQNTKRKFGIINSLLFICVIFLSCSKERQDNDTSNPIPISLAKADFSFTLDTSKISVIKFTNLSTKAIKYKWIFGDGQESVEKNPVHTYPNDGVFEVVLTATDSLNLSNNITKSITVQSKKGRAVFYWARSLGGPQPGFFIFSFDNKGPFQLTGFFLNGATPDCMNQNSGYSYIATQDTGIYNYLAKEQRDDLSWKEWTGTYRVKGGSCTKVNLTK